MKEDVKFVLSTKQCYANETMNGETGLGGSPYPKT